MTERVLGPTGSPRRRWTLLLPLIAVLAIGVLYIAGAQAVNATGAFELDGNAVSTTGNAGTGADDWDRVCQEVVGGSSCSTTATTQTTNPKSTTRTWKDAGGTPEIYTGGGSKTPRTRRRTGCGSRRTPCPTRTRSSTPSPPGTR